MAHFSEQIRKWYLLNYRKLPWRSTQNPYYIWVSEIILQQTRVNQGLEYYNRFIQRFPTVQKLAQASDEQVLKQWQGLGYYSRARNMHKAAQYVVKELKGNFPTDYHALLQLPGIGPYTAAAISSFTANQPFAVVDGNVLRVLSRYFLVTEPVNSTAGRKIIDALAAEILPAQHAAQHNQAIMELGALVCTPKPACTQCPVNDSCLALRKNKTSDLPVKLEKTAVRDRYMTYYFIHNRTSFLLRKRTGNDIWKSMFDFPSLESDKPISAAAQKKYALSLTTQKNLHPVAAGKPMLHLLSHRRLHISFIELEVKKLPVIAQTQLVTKQQLKRFALPKPIELFMKQYAGKQL